MRGVPTVLVHPPVCVPVLSRLRACGRRASHVCPLFSLLLLSVLDEAVPAVPEDDGKLSVGPHVLMSSLSLWLSASVFVCCYRVAVAALAPPRQRGLPGLPLLRMRAVPEGACGHVSLCPVQVSSVPVSRPHRHLQASGRTFRPADKPAEDDSQQAGSETRRG